MASLAPRLLLLLASAAFTLGVIEVAARVLAPQPLPSDADPPLLRGQLTRPGAHRVKTPEFDVEVQVNDAGFVDRPWGPRRPVVPRVVVIGDSFVQAAQVPMDQGFGRALARQLSRARGGEVEVLSLGVPGAGTATAFELLDAYALDLAPDAVLLGFLVSNDVLNNHPLLEQKTDKPFYALTGGGALVRTAPEAAVAPGPGWLWRGSHAWRWAVRAAVEKAVAEQKVALGGGVPVDLRVHDPAPSATWEEAWAVTDALIDAMAARCAEAGVTFGVALFPDSLQATRAGADRARAAWPDAAGWDFSVAQARAGAIAAGHGPVVDLLPAIAAADRGDPQPPLYFAQDGHWTARGHAAAAEAAADFAAGLLEQASTGD